MGVVRSATEFHAIGQEYSIARSYEAWLESRHGGETSSAVGVARRHRKIPIEAHGDGCAACGVPSRILWGASADDALFCSDCLDDGGPARAEDELGGSG